MRSGRSTVTFQYPKVALGKILDCSVSLERHERLGDVVDVVLGQFAVLLAEVPGVGA